MTRQRKEPEVRRAELVRAAATLFAERGVSDTAVSDIVKAVGVAQGTFYLYFESKDAIVCAVVEAFVDDMIAYIGGSLSDSQSSAIEKVDAIVTALLEMHDEPYEVELMNVLHRPENREIHDRLMHGMGLRLLPHITAILEQGVAEGTFVAEDPDKTAWFIIGALRGLETGFSDVDETREAIEQLKTFVLRALGYHESR